MRWSKEFENGQVKNRLEVVEAEKESYQSIGSVALSQIF